MLIPESHWNSALKELKEVYLMRDRESIYMIQEPARLAEVLLIQSVQDNSYLQ